MVVRLGSLASMRVMAGLAESGASAESGMATILTSPNLASVAQCCALSTPSASLPCASTKAVIIRSLPFGVLFSPFAPAVVPISCACTAARRTQADILAY